MDENEQSLNKKIVEKIATIENKLDELIEIFCEISEDNKACATKVTENDRISISKTNLLDILTDFVEYKMEKSFDINDFCNYAFRQWGYDHDV